MLWKGNGSEGTSRAPPKAFGVTSWDLYLLEKDEAARSLFQLVQGVELRTGCYLGMVHRDRHLHTEFLSQMED